MKEWIGERWSREALRLLQAIESPRFSARETAAYRRRLMGEIERKVQVLGTSMPLPKEQYMGTYRILVDTYKVYYSLNAEHTEAYIERLSICACSDHRSHRPLCNYRSS